MKPNFTQICRITAITFLVFVLSSKVFGQNKEVLEFKYKIQSEIVDNEEIYKVTITVTKGEGPYKYELCDKSLALGGRSLMVSESTSEKSYVFSNLKGKEYYVYVYLTAQEFGKGKIIQIK